MDLHLLILLFPQVWQFIIKWVRGPTETAYVRGPDFCATPLAGGMQNVHELNKVSFGIHLT